MIRFHLFRSQKIKIIELPTTLILNAYDVLFFSSKTLYSHSFRDLQRSHHSRYLCSDDTGTQYTTSKGGRWKAAVVFLFFVISHFIFKVIFSHLFLYSFWSCV